MSKGSYDDFASEEFIKDPSEFSKKTLDIARQSAERYKDLLDQNTFLDKLKKGIKLRLRYQEGYKDTLKWLDGFRITGNDILGMYKDFAEISDKIAINNILLAYSMSVEKETSNKILTKEDEKASALKELRSGKISRGNFNKRFGHYALNPFEVSSERFSEFSEKKIMMIAENCPEPLTEGKMSLKEYMESGRAQKFPIYNGLREELRSLGIRAIADIRYKLREIAKKNDISDIFSMSYEDVIKYG